MEYIQYGILQEHWHRGFSRRQLLDIIKETSITSAFSNLNTKSTLKGGMAQLPITLVDNVLAGGSVGLKTL
jgi:hypothetical protein